MHPEFAAEQEYLPALAKCGAIGAGGFLWLSVNEGAHQLSVDELL